MVPSTSSQVSPVMELPAAGAAPTSPVMAETGTFDTPVAARTAKLSAVPNGTVGVAACALPARPTTSPAASSAIDEVMKRGWSRAGASPGSLMSTHATGADQQQHAEDGDGGVEPPGSGGCGRDGERGTGVGEGDGGFRGAFDQAARRVMTAFQGPSGSCSSSAIVTGCMLPIARVLPRVAGNGPALSHWRATTREPSRRPCCNHPPNARW